MYGQDDEDRSGGWPMGRSIMLIAVVVTCGCALPREGRTADEVALQERTVEVEGIARRYLVAAPPNLQPDEQVPLVVMFHGGGGQGRAAAKETGWPGKALEERFIAVFPEGTGPDPEAPGSFLRNPQIWHDGSGRFRRERAWDDVAFIDRMLDELVEDYPVDTSRVYATGFSNGASMTFRVGVELSTRFAAVASVAGAFWLEDPQPERPVPLLYITGEEDPLNPMEGGVPTTASGRVMGAGVSKPPVLDSITKWAEMIGCPDDPTPTEAPEGVTAMRYGPCEDGSEVRYYTIADCGHVWPGGNNLLPERVVGPETDVLDATDLIWEFFREHSLARGDDGQ
jgi:polyhydroxybutyrate depolymerase